MDQQPISQPTITETQPPSSKPLGPILGIIIVVVIMLLGGLYFWGAQLQREALQQDSLPYILDDNTNRNDDSAGLPPTSSSDTVGAIETDLNATDLGEVETQMNADMSALEAQ